MKVVLTVLELLFISVSFDVESIVRKIMLRRLLSRRVAPKVEKNNEEVQSTPVNNDKNDNKNNNKPEEETPKKVQTLVPICYYSFSPSILIAWFVHFLPEVT